MSFELVIFDCDGVLVDSESLSNDALTEMLVTYGYQITSAETKQRFLGSSLTKCLETLQEESGIKLPEAFEASFRKRMSAVFESHLRPVDGAQRLIDSLRIPYCVASSGPRRKIEENLNFTGLLPRFADNIFSAYEVRKWKPDPGLFLAAARHFGVAPKNCVVIEDSSVGVEAGLAAEMTVLALSAEPHTSTVASASRVFSKLDEVRSYLISQGVATT